jgi:hypothetical protein
MMNKWDYYRYDLTSGTWWGADWTGVLTWAKKEGYILAIHPGSPSRIETLSGDRDWVGLLEDLKTKAGLFIGETVDIAVWRNRLAACNNDAEFPIGGRVNDP